MDIPIPEKYRLKKQPKQKRTKLLLHTICDASVRVINERGIRALNTNLIAEYAGVDVSSLYQFFASKEAILYQVAVDWVEQYWSVYVSFDSDPDLLELDWCDYFSRLMAAWVLPDQDEKHTALQSLWRTYPEFEELEIFQLERHIDFIMRHLRRLGAKGTDKQLRDLSVYMFYVEDSVNELIAEPNTTEASESLLELYQSSILFLLGRLFDNT